MTNHVAWRAAFAIVPVPILLFVAAITLIFGTDCPAGKWSQRHDVPATAVALARGHQLHLNKDEQVSKKDVEGGAVSVVAAAEEGETAAKEAAEVDVAVNESLTKAVALRILSSPQTWLPALSYFTTFGLELSVSITVVTHREAVRKITSRCITLSYLHPNCRSMQTTKTCCTPCTKAHRKTTRRSTRATSLRSLAS